VEESEPESIIKETVVGFTLEEALVKGVAAAVNVPVPEQDEEPMSAQEKLEGILQNWEETQRAVEQEIERKKQQAEAEREAKRKERAAQSMFDTTPIIPDDIQQLLDDLENEMKASEEAEEDVEIEEIIEEPTVDNTEATEPAEELQEEIVEEVTGMETVETEEPITEEEPAEVIEEAPVVEATEEPEEEVVSEPVEDFADDDDIIEKQFDISFQEETETKDDALEQLQSEMTTDADKDTEGVSFDTGFIVQGKYDLEAQSEIGLKAGLTEEQKKLFSYFVPVRGMSEQIVEVLENDKNCNSRYGTSRTGNILVVGRQGTGKTVLAVNVVKAIQKARRLKQGKVAIVTGEALNKKELSTVLGKLKGGALIVEKAGKMNQSTVEELSRKMEEQTGELLVVLEEQRKPLEKLLSENPGFKRKFTSKLELPIFINDELVTFGQTYAKENGYKIDEMGILALYSRIDILQKEDHAVTVTEVKEIIDHAIEKAQRVNIKHFFKRLFGKHTDNADRVILTEQDFK
ncbi:P-loop NTPase family protein, partial [Faecalimonas sp.]